MRRIRYRTAHQPVPAGRAARSFTAVDGCLLFAALSVLFVVVTPESHGQVGYGIEETEVRRAKARRDSIRVTEEARARAWAAVEEALQAVEGEPELDEAELTAEPGERRAEPQPGAGETAPDRQADVSGPGTTTTATGAAAPSGESGLGDEFGPGAARPPEEGPRPPAVETGAEPAGADVGPTQPQAAAGSSAQDQLEAPTTVERPIIKGAERGGPTLDDLVGDSVKRLIPSELLQAPTEARLLQGTEVAPPRYLEREDAHVQLWTWTPRLSADLEERRALLINGAAAEVSRSYYLEVPGDRRTDHVQVDLERRQVSRSTQVGEVILEPARPLPLESYVYESMVIGRWDAWSTQSRTGVGKSLDESSFISADGSQGVKIGTDFDAGPMEPILGRGQASITIRGSERITMSGTSRWDANLRETDNIRQSKFPQLDLRQDLNIQVDGQVGDKVTIDWKEDSNAQTSLANRISIRYRGYDDEVISSMDLGNTSLSLPGTGFVSYNGVHTGLFGVKATGKLGDYDITTIASKQEGQTASSSYTGRAQQTSRQIFDLDYIQRRFFFLIDPVDPLLTGDLVPPPFENAAGQPPPPESARWIPPPIIENLTVWLDNRNQQDNAGLPDGHLFLDPSNVVARNDSTPADSLSGVFDVLTEQEDYILRSDLFTLSAQNAGIDDVFRYPVLDMLRPIGTNERLGVTFTATYSVPDGAGGFRDSVVVYGTTPAEGEGRLRAKAVYLPPGDYPRSGDFYNPADFFFPVRNLELRNIYDIGGRDIDLTTFELTVSTRLGEQREHLEGDPEATYLRMLGVDKEDEFTNPGFDNIIDRAFIYPGTGLIILPDLRPFAPAAVDSVWPFHYVDLGVNQTSPEPDQRPAYFVGANSNRAVYEKKNINRGTDATYQFQIRYATPQSQFVLGAAGTILDGSETVSVDGQILRRGTDYNIDYETGIVNLTGTADIPPEADVQIDYAYAPLFALGQKTLMGTHIGWTPGPNRRMGATFLFESSGVSERRPKLGEEPSRTLVGDLNGGLETTPYWMTQFVDALPGMRARGDSRLQFNGELAMSFPNPNTRDQVYLDDFEGAKETSILSINREQWFFASPPVSIQEQPGNGVRGDLIWYNPVISPAHEGDLFPDLDEVEARDRKQVLMMRIEPPTDATVPPEETWVGLTQGVSSTGADFTRKQFIEIWINDLNDDATRLSDARMIIDLGLINEDANLNEEWDREDVNADGILDLNETGLYEDTGLDLLRSPEEPGYDPETNPDPNQDDFDFDRQAGEDAFNYAAYEKINRFEDNRRLDDEDVNRDNDLQRENANAYLQFEVSLADTASAFVATNVRRDFPGNDVDRDGRSNGWRLYRIPIEAGAGVRSPSLGSVRHLRIWFTGIAEPVTMQIASIDIQGNLYEVDPLRQDGEAVLAAPGEFFKIRGINNKEDANEYLPPFDLEQRDRVTEREGSLALDFIDLQPQREGSAFRAFATERDFTLYQTLRWYVYAGEEPQRPGTVVDSVEVFVRFGADTLNYYEYAVPFVDLAGPQWFEIDVPVTDLSGLKAVADNDSVFSTVVDGRVLKLVGSPSFTRVRRLTFGVRNIASTQRSGSLWVNDLRLDDVIRDIGTATRFNLDMDFADFLKVSSDLLTQDEDFLSIGSQGRRQVSRGTGSRRRDVGLRTTANLHKFYETSGFRTPVTFTLNDNLELPLFRVGDDVVLEPQQSEDQKRGSNNRSVAVSLSRSQPNSPGLLKYTVDAMRADFSLRDNRSLSQTRRDSSRAISFNASYSPQPNFRPLKLGRMEFRYFPESINTSLRFNSDRRFNYSRDLDNPEVAELVSATYTKNVFLNGSVGYSPLRSVRGNYRIDARRDLIKENPASWLFGINIGDETQRIQNLDVTWTPPVPRISPNLSFRGGSRDDHNSNLQLAGDTEQVRNLGATQTVSAGFVLPLTLITGSGARRAPEAPGGLLAGLQDALARVGRFQDVRVSGNLTQNRDFQYATGVPRWQYYLGISTHPGPDVRLTSRGREDQSKSRSANMTSGIDFAGGVTLNGGFGYNKRENWASFSEPRVNQTRSWPELDLSWRQLHQKIPVLGRLFRSLNLDSGYKKDRSETGPLVDPTQNVTIRSDWNPIFNLNGTLVSGWTARVQLTSSTTRDERNNAGLGQFTNNRRRRLSISFSRRYDRRSGFKLPWQANPVNLNGDLTLNFDIDRSSDFSEQGRSGAQAVLQRDNSNTTFRAGSTYQFRRNVDANFTFNFGRNNDNKSGSKRRTLALTLSLNFRF